MQVETNIINRTYLKVEFPQELTDYVMEQTQVCGRYLKVREKGNSTHHLAKVLGFYLLLKAEAPVAGLIQNYTKQIPILSRNFNISPRSFFTYIKQLEAMKLVSREGNNIRVASWHQLADQLGINTRKRTQINFTYAGKQKIHWWFAALEIKANQELQSDMVWKKANKNAAVEALLHEALMKRGFDRTKANNPEYYAGRLFMLYIEDFKTGTEVHDILIHIRSDVNRGCKKIAESWSMSPQLVSYWKKKMQDQKIIDVAKLSVMSEWTSTTKECHKNKFCHVIWDDKAKERVWFLCDQVTILMPWKWQEYLGISEAA